MTPPKLTLEKVTDSNINYEFVANVAARFFKILFRSDKKIRLIYSNYSNKHFLGDKFIVLNYRFRNALWYKIEDATTDKRQFVIEKPDASRRMMLTVYGFFKKKTFALNFEEANFLENNNFCVEIKKTSLQNMHNPILN